MANVPAGRYPTDAVDYRHGRTVVGAYVINGYHWSDAVPVRSMHFFDTHAHLDQPEFDADRAEVIERARQGGVETILAVGITAASSLACVELAASQVGVLAAVGIQPNYCAQAEPR